MRKNKEKHIIRRRVNFKERFLMFASELMITLFTFVFCITTLVVSVNIFPLIFSYIHNYTLALVASILTGGVCGTAASNIFANIYIYMFVCTVIGK